MNLSPQSLVVNFIYASRIIGEVEIRLGGKNIYTEANKFLSELLTAQSALHLKQLLIYEVDKLSKNGNIYEPVNYVFEKYDERCV